MTDSTVTNGGSPDSTADIVDTAVAAGAFTTLTAAVTAAGLVDTLKGPGPFTVFAPTEAAFAKLPAGTVEALLTDPTGTLAEILKYHVVAGTVMAADVVGLNGQKVTTVQGGEFTVQVAGGLVALVDATGQQVNVVTTDIACSNGVIHVIDAVLLPSA
ncbi:MAG: fasciclin domain-containing protein [Propionibacteriaceae bacterium]